MALESPRAKQLGCMIMAGTKRIDQLWALEGGCSPSTLLGWMGKSQASITDKIDVLRTVRI